MRRVTTTLALLLSLSISRHNGAVASPILDTTSGPSPVATSDTARSTGDGESRTDPSIPAVEGPLPPGQYVGEEWCTLTLYLEGAAPLTLTEPACSALDVGTNGLPAGLDDPDDAEQLGGSSRVLDVCIGTTGVTITRSLQLTAGLVVGQGTAWATYSTLPDGAVAIEGRTIVTGHYQDLPATLIMHCQTVLDPAD